MNHLPAQMTKEELVDLLRSLAMRVDEGDSFEGFIEYLIPSEEEHIKAGLFDVRARYRIGNTEGQGGMAIFGKFE